ncbi:hypothetical protein BJ165DRAFT_1406859 [Panaeolus papilionaceus]|nr:hypothetical protein BJ165DRAFT_1406859 [Panaeolus papilionaceus]
MNSWRSLRVKNSTDGNPAPPSITDPLAIKLSLRFLKAKLNSLARGLISLHAKRRRIKERPAKSFCAELLAKGATSSSQNAELQHIWGVWQKTKEDCQRHTVEQYKKNVEQAEKRLRALPVYRPSLYDVAEYFRFGHDAPRPLFYEISTFEEAKLLINARFLLGQDWKKISFLFGGSGEGRHVFATLINWGYIWNLISRRRGASSSDYRIPDLHLTLLDIHPASIARVMLLLGLIRRSMTARVTTFKLELEATAFYVFSTIFMPDYCAKLVATVSGEILEELKGKPPKHLTKFWAIDDQTKPRVLTILEYWSKPLNKNTKTFFEINGPKKSRQMTHQFLAQTARLALDARRQMRNENLQNFLISMRQSTGSPVSLGKKDPKLPLYNDWDAEDSLFQRTRVLLPPKQLLSRHPALEKHVRSNGQQGEQEVIEEVFKDWKPNPTIFDNNTTENPAYSKPGGYPHLTFDEDPSVNMSWIMDVFRHYRGDTRSDMLFDQTAFVTMQQFFDSVRVCLEAMDGRQDALTLEFVCAELCSGISQLVAGDFGPRPSSFPTKYMRMWLSNVPDYTSGVLGNLVYLTPYLEDNPYAVMLWNCLVIEALSRRTKNFASSTPYTYLTASGIERFFNCLARDENNEAVENMAFLVSKKELHNYLAWMLSRVLCCPYPGNPPFDVDEPTNMVTFIRLIIAFCRTYACPGHWLAEFMQHLVDDTLVTNAVPYHGLLPVKQMPAPARSEDKISLEGYQLELEVILVTIKPARRFYSLKMGVKVQVLSMVDLMDFQKGLVAWKMSEGWYEKMREDGWVMIVWVTTRRWTISKPVPASEWTQITATDPTVSPSK